MLAGLLTGLVYIIGLFVAKILGETYILGFVFGFICGLIPVSKFLLDD